MLDGLEYRGTAFFQAYTTCQPEHGVPDNMSADQAKTGPRRARHAGVRLQSAQRRDLAGSLRPQGQPDTNRDWWRTKYKTNGENTTSRVAHWALTEGRFRKHVKASRKRTRR
jgi:pyruvate-ferredoxin/flavodoxin oxidoreductase